MGRSLLSTTALLLAGRDAGQQSAFTRQWNVAPLSCVHPVRREVNPCFSTPLFDVEPLGPYTNDCHIALEVCPPVSLFLFLSVCLFLAWYNDGLRYTEVRYGIGNTVEDSSGVSFLSPDALVGVSIKWACRQQNCPNYIFWFLTGGVSCPV